MYALARVTLFRQLLAGGTVALFVGMLVVGTWVANEIERGVVHRAGLITGLFVDSYVSGYVQSLAEKGALTDQEAERLDHLLTGTPLGRQIVSVKVWSRDGRILFSTNPALVGRQYPVKPALAAAFAGEVRSELSTLGDPDNAPERELWSRLIDTYAPVRARDGDRAVLAVIEFYHATDDLLREVNAAKTRSWIMVTVATLVMLALFALLSRRAHYTILAQQGELRRKVDQLTALLAQNEQLHEKVSRAAGRTTALNERFLHRVGADLHDGAGQGLALALMRMETLAARCKDCMAEVAHGKTVSDELRTLQEALRGALHDLRSVYKGLHLPDVEQYSVAETVRRAVRDYQRTSGVAPGVCLENLPEDAPLAQKITLFRLLQESLANGYRHGGAVDQHVTVRGRDGALDIEVSDKGSGFEPERTVTDGHLGLDSMRERVEILGGTFSLASVPGKGTVVRATVPLAGLEVEHE